MSRLVLAIFGVIFQPRYRRNIIFLSITAIAKYLPQGTPLNLCFPTVSPPLILGISGRKAIIICWPFAF